MAFWTINNLNAFAFTKNTYNIHISHINTEY